MEVNASLINFAAGVLSKKFLGRIDLPNFYKAGLLTCRNFIPQAQGPAEFRPGTRHVMHTRLNSPTVLYPFVFNDEQAYALAFSDQKLRFFSGGEYIVSTADDIQFALLAHFDGIDGATASTATTGQAFVFSGDAELDTAIKKFGTAALKLAGTGYVTANDNIILGTNDFTIDLQVSYASLPGGSAEYALFGIGTYNSGGITARYREGKLEVFINSASAVFSETWTPTLNQMYHLAFVRKSGQVYVFVDGVQLGSAFADTSNLTTSTGVILGFWTGQGKHVGNIDEVAIRNGEGMWSANFTPPSAAYSTSNTFNITNITAADPGVVTITSHGFSDGDEIYISGVLGMTEINDQFYLVDYIDANTFSLTDNDGNAIDTSAFTAYVSGGIVEKIYEIDTPYREEDLDQLQFAQKADLMYIVHPNYEPRKLIRSGDASWTLSTFTRTSDPFTKAITGVTRATPGVVTCTNHGFVNGDLVEIWGVSGMTQLNGNTYKVANKATSTFELTDPTTDANINTSGFGAYTSGGYAFKSGNMPGAVAFYLGRLFYGGTDDDPETFWGSKAPTNAGANQYDVFTVGTSAGDAIIFPISSQNNTADRIQWLAGTNRFLGIGTFGGVYKGNGGTDGTPMTGTAIGVQVIEYAGCKALMPVRVGSALFYVQRGGLILNRFSFSLLADDFTAFSLNVFSDELTFSGLRQLSVQQGTSDIIWGVTNDGQLLGITVKTSEEISAWHGPHLLGGTDTKVLSVCGEPQADNRDNLWLVVERTVGGVTRRFIEYLAAEDLLPEPEDFYTGVKATDDLTYRASLYEQAKQLVRVDSSLTLDQSQTVALTPGATTGTGVAFTSVGDVFSATDVGRYIIKKVITGEETGVALITAYVSATEVTCTILEDFDSTDAISELNWYLTVTSLSGLAHLEGETVRIQIDGADGGTQVVTDGTITLGTPGTVIHVGLPYVGRITPMPLEIGALAGTAQARITTVNRLGLLVRNTLGVKYGTDIYNLRQMKSRSFDEHFNRPPLLTTDALELQITDGYAKRKQIHIVQDSPFPCTIQGIVPFVDTTNE